MDQYKIIFSTKEANREVAFNKEFKELKEAFDWSDWFKSKHSWVNEYKIKPIFEKRRQRKHEESRS